MAYNTLGELVPGWVPPQRLGPMDITGRFVHLTPLSAQEHAADLYQAFGGYDKIWDYMASGPFISSAQFFKWVSDTTANDDCVYFAIRDMTTGQLGGVVSYLRIAPNQGSIEVGNIALAPHFQKTTAATEAMYLMMKWAFEAGYRRYEWKCNALNIPSRRAAQRLGLSYEGVFRQALVVKGRNRDTAWFAAIDKDWPALKEAFEAWLAPQNFTSEGNQKERLGDLTALVRVASDPAL